MLGRIKEGCLSMAEKLMLVDGHSLMYRAFHALPLLDNGEGIYTNAVHGFLSMLFSAIAMEKPDYLGVAFDMHAPTFRHGLFDGYKASRAPTPPELRPQFDLAREILGAMHIPIFSIAGLEGDDMLGTMARQASEKGIEALLITGDRDSFQLADERTTILYTKRGISDVERVTPEFVREKYGIQPRQLIDVKALMGDKSDEIPGIAGIGEKTALKLIVQYGTLEAALDSVPDQKGVLKARLEGGREAAMLSRQLATIERYADIAWDEEALRMRDMEDARPLLRQYKLNSLLTKLDQLQGVAAKAASVAVESAIKWQKAHAVSGIGALREWAVENANAPRIAICFGASISLATDQGACAVMGLGGDLLTPGPSEEEALIAIRPILEGGAQIVCHSTKALRAQMERIGIPGRCNACDHDLMLGAYVLDAQRRSYDVDALVCEEPCYDEDAPAAAMICLAQRQRELLQQDGLWRVYEEIELPLAKALYGMECRGFCVDREELRRLGVEYQHHISQLTQDICALAGRPININSPKQLREWLFDELGLETGKKTTRGFSTSAEVLEQLVDAHPAVEMILEYRKYAKLKSTYVDALLRLCGEDGRVRTSFDQVATVTGRISSNEPNLQNIPVRTEMGREIRKAFVAGDGMVLVDADYSQIELRVLAHMSGDAVMTEAFLLGQDIHSRTAAEVYGVALEDVTKQMRSAAKAVNFGIVYGISDFGLARNIGVTRKEAKEFIERYLARYAGIKRFMDDCVAKGKLNGYAETLFGRRRYLPELLSGNYNQRNFGERAAMNSPIQGTAADIIKMAMVRVDEALEREGLQARMILQVHDELIVEAPAEEAERAGEILRTEMEDVAKLSVPLVADVSSGGNWNACK